MDAKIVFLTCLLAVVISVSVSVTLVSQSGRKLEIVGKDYTVTHVLTVEETLKICDKGTNPSYNKTVLINRTSVTFSVCEFTLTDKEELVCRCFV